MVDSGKLAKGGSTTDVDYLSLVHFDNIGNLEFYSYCLNEGMRYQPPVLLTSTISFTKDCTLDWLKVREGDCLFIDIDRIHHHPNAWREPERFIPDRFNSKSKYFLTPAGKPRNPFSFMPFLGGQRICLGKTFVDTASKLIVPTLLTHFEMEFVDGVDPEKYELPPNNLTCTYIVKNDIRITPANRVYKHNPANLC